MGYTNIVDYIDEHKWIAVILSIFSFVLVLLLILSLIPSPFKGGYILEKRIEERKEWNTEEEEDQYRTIYVPVIRTSIDSDGNVTTTTDLESQRIYDHTDIVTYHYIDDKDFIFTVESQNNKAGYNWYQRNFDKDRPNKKFIIYVEEHIYERARIESIFVEKETKYWRRDHIEKIEIARRDR
jgi:hypothetical protein